MGARAGREQDSVLGANGVLEFSDSPQQEAELPAWPWGFLIGVPAEIPCDGIQAGEGFELFGRRSILGALHSQDIAFLEFGLGPIVLFEDRALRDGGVLEGHPDGAMAEQLHQGREADSRAQ